MCRDLPPLRVSSSQRVQHPKQAGIQLGLTHNKFSEYNVIITDRNVYTK